MRVVLIIASWLVAITAVVLLARLRGWRGITLLIGCLIAVVLLAVVWNVVANWTMGGNQT
jgi:hypothetical protein